jgi:hypothetical protein
VFADQIERDVSIYIARSRPRRYMKVPGVDFSHQLRCGRYCLSCEQYPHTPSYVKIFFTMGFFKSKNGMRAVTPQQLPGR